MRIDPHTVQDLEILRTTSGTSGLLDQLDRTRTRGGRDVFRRRLLEPLNSAAAINDVQQCLRYIQHNRPKFIELPDDSDIGELNHYLESRFVTLTRIGGPALTVEGWWIRIKYQDLFEFARHGVALVARFLGRIDRIQAGLSGMPTALDAFLRDVRAILAAPDVQQLRVVGRRLELPSAMLVRDHIARETARGQLHRLIEIVCELDALISMSDVTKEQGFAYPTVEENHGGVELHDVYHPFLADPIRNDFVLSPSTRVVFLTGPNMAGKTTYLKAVGIAVVLAHAGMGVPASKCRLSVIDQLTTAIRTADNLRENVSYFQAEARRVREMATALAAGRRCLFIVDELFRGTNVKDAYDASLTVLKAFAEAQRGMFLVASHLIELAEEMARTPGLLLQRFEADLLEGGVAFDYRLRPGVSSQRLGMMVLQREGVIDALAGVRAAGHGGLGTAHSA